MVSMWVRDRCVRAVSPDGGKLGLKGPGAGRDVFGMGWDEMDGGTVVVEGWQVADGEEGS